MATLVLTALLCTSCAADTDRDSAPANSSSPTPHGYVEGAKESAGQQSRLLLSDPGNGDRRALDRITGKVHVFGYLAERFDFRVIGAVIPSGTTLASPSSSDLSSLAQAMEEAGVHTVFADSSQPKRLAEVLRTELDDQVRVIELHSESLTAKGEGAGTYLQMMRANTAAMTDGLTDAA